MSRAQLGDERRLVCVAPRFFVRPLAAHAVGVVGVEVGAMPAGVGDVVGETGQPLQEVHGLEVPAERGVHAGAVEDGLCARRNLSASK